MNQNTVHHLSNLNFPANPLVFNKQNYNCNFQIVLNLYLQFTTSLISMNRQENSSFTNGNPCFGLFLRRSNEDENTLKNYAAFINITRYTDGMKIRKISNENAWI